MTHKITDNFLPEEEFKDLKSFFLSSDIEWFYNKKVAFDEAEANHDFGFTHTFYMNNQWTSSFAPLLDPILDKINPFSIIRIKANLATKAPEHFETGWHRDFDKECKTAVFYLNTNNGYTLFENDVRVDSIENRFVEFNSLEKHTGVTHTDENVRVLINFNYI